MDIPFDYKLHHDRSSRPGTPALFVPEEKSNNMEEFDVTQIRPHGVFLLVGKKLSGKSFLVRDMVYRQRHDIRAGFAVVGSDRNDPCWIGYPDFFPSEHIHGEYSPAIFGDLMRRHHSSHPPMTPSLVYLDDCIYDRTWTKDRALQGLFYNGRCTKTTLVIAMQYPLSIPESLMANTDYVFVLPDKMDLGRQRTYDRWVLGTSAFPSYQAFCEAMDECETHGPYTALVIANAYDASNGTKAFWYRASNHETFKTFDAVDAVDTVAMEPNDGSS